MSRDGIKGDAVVRAVPVSELKGGEEILVGISHLEPYLVESVEPVGRTLVIHTLRENGRPHHIYNAGVVFVLVASINPEEWDLRARDPLDTPIRGHQASPGRRDPARPAPPVGGGYKVDHILRYKDPLPPVQRFTAQDDPVPWTSGLYGLYWTIECPQCGWIVTWGRNRPDPKEAICTCGIHWRVEVRAVGERVNHEQA